MRPLLAIPVFNEQLHLPRVLEAVARFPVDALVIDDGSTDETPRLLASRRDMRVITHPENRGYGQSLIDAFHFAAARRYHWVITMDCDEQHEPAQIPEFLAEIQHTRADVISGSRYLREFAGDDHPPRDRRRINQTITDLLAQILDLRLTDSFCGFKAHRVSAMCRLRLDEPGYAFPLQFWVQCARQRLRVHEWPVRRIYRDLSREFGGTLDDPAARIQHYLEVLLRELRREPAATESHDDEAACRCPLQS